MNRTQEIIMQAALIKTFAVASNLARWPEFLPHGRIQPFCVANAVGRDRRNVVRQAGGHDPVAFSSTESIRRTAHYPYADVRKSLTRIVTSRPLQGLKTSRRGLPRPPLG